MRRRINEDQWRELSTNKVWQSQTGPAHLACFQRRVHTHTHGQRNCFIIKYRHLRILNPEFLFCFEYTSPDTYVWTWNNWVWRAGDLQSYFFNHQNIVYYIHSVCHIFRMLTLPVLMAAERNWKMLVKPFWPILWEYYKHSPKRPWAYRVVQQILQILSNSSKRG